MRSVLFVGPTYPPEWVMNRIRDIVVNIVYQDNQAVVGNNTHNSVSPVVVDNLTLSPAGVHCRVRYTNPITGVTIHGSTSDGSVTVVTTADNAASEDVFQGGPYNISPCCVAMTRVEQFDAETPAMVVSCTSPLRCTVSNSVLEIVADAAPLSMAEDTSSSDVGVRSINGLTTVTGDLSVTGVGEVTVAIIGQDGVK
jgi:hypothetical protein